MAAEAITVDEFLVGLEDKADHTRYELIAGQPLAMAREPVAHARLKAQVWLALCKGIESRGLPCEALPNGMALKIDEHTPTSPTRSYTAARGSPTMRSWCPSR